MSDDDIEQALVSGGREAAGSFAVLGDPRLSEAGMSMPLKAPGPWIQLPGDPLDPRRQHGAVERRQGETGRTTGSE